MTATEPDGLSSGPAGPDGPGDAAVIWDAVERSRSWLDEMNGTSRHEQTMRLLKLVEETGEVAQAWTGIQGQNPRKGVTHTVPELVGELGDVAFTALVAAASFGAHPYDVLAAIAAKMHDRLNPAAPAGAQSDGKPTAAAEASPADDAAGAAALDPGQHAVPAGDVFAMLIAVAVAVANAQTRRFPRRNGPFHRLARLHEESGEVAKAVGHAEDTGVKTQQHGPFDPQDLAGELVDVLLTTVGLAVHYGLEDRLAAVIAARYGRYQQRGYLPGQTPADTPAGTL